MTCLVAAAVAAPQYHYKRPQSNQAAPSVSADQWAAMNPLNSQNGDLEEIKNQWERFLE
jgi:hypothetical protein